MKKEQIILLHGALGSKKQLQELRSTLSEKYNVAYMDFEGHGGRASSNSFSIDLFADNVKVRMEELQIDRTSIFGYSMGGYVALKLAQKHPQLVHKIITLGTKFEWNEKTAAQETRKLIPGKIEEKVPAFAAYLNKLHSPEDWKTLVIKTADLLSEMGKGNKLSNTDLQMINHPIQVCIGELDDLVTLQESKEAAKQLKNSSLMVLPNVKHPIQQVPVLQLAKIIEAFI